jgi:hypothetical protein
MNNEEYTRRENIKEIHDFSSWAKKVEAKKSRKLKTAFSLSKGDFSDMGNFLNWELVRKEPIGTERPGCKGTEYLWKNPEDKKEELVQIRVIECNSYSEAHEAIIDFMMHSTLPKFPTDKKIGTSIGDVCFLGHNETPTGIVFSRDNITVSIRSVGKNNVSVKEIAEKIDSIIAG